MHEEEKLVFELILCREGAGERGGEGGGGRECGR